MLTVLCVDDSPLMRNMVTQTLESSGHYRCLQAGDGKEGLEQLAKHKVDLVVTDLNMPVMNGLDFIQAIRAVAAHRYTPILMLTTENSDALKATARERGATGWMVKPFSADKLLRTLEKIVAVV